MVKKLVVPYVSIKSLHLKVPESSSPRSQQPATCPYRANTQPFYLFNCTGVAVLINVVVQLTAVRFGIGLHIHIQDRRPTIATRDFLDFSSVVTVQFRDTIANWAPLCKRSGRNVPSCKSIFKQASDR